jgi:hypothetical protein
MEEMKKRYKILVGKPEQKRPLGRSRGRWEDSITLDVREMGWKDVEWIHLAQGRDQSRDVMKTKMKFRVP